MLNKEIPKSKLFWGNNIISDKDKQNLKKLKIFLTSAIFLPNFLFLFKKDIKTYKDYPTFSFIIRNGYNRILNIILFFISHYYLFKISISRKAFGLLIFSIITSIATILLFKFPDNKKEKSKKHRKVAYFYFTLLLFLLLFIKNTKIILILMILLTIMFIIDSKKKIILIFKK